jgi:hypothetical protein
MPRRTKRARAIHALLTGIVFLLGLGVLMCAYNYVILTESLLWYTYTEPEHVEMAR